MSRAPLPGVPTPWHRDPRALRLLLLVYLPLLGAMNLAWEMAHLPLYTLWREATPQELAFVVAHCTLGDVMIGFSAIALALIGLHAAALSAWRWPRVAAVATAIGVAYTALSEWLNVVALRSWAYAEAMPTLRLGEFELGLSPIAQWLVIPPLALWLARRRAASDAERAAVSAAPAR